ncbi:MerR family transcriptional regulator [Clostridium sp. YIM B02515]|uniref:MerR family transcriptional regulator n=1 Tax=Clostridium rhizosphaerae TaxID=2803861 RepID=A0ABS1TCY2_9CLOT|nr:MerR family transcriptional regulator [Clostridium rhizosphaerae]MBL4937190.1 MerR family transcriptional regulator [Clostridium rhizosphaerae]
MFKIGEFSNLSGLSINTLHHYNEIDILKPEQVDKFSGYRYYSANQLVTVNKIMALKDAGFSLNEISRILCSLPSIDTMISMLENKAEALEQALKNESERLNRLRTNIFLIKNGGVPIMNEITIKRVEPILIASTRKNINKDDFEEAGKMWTSVNSFIDKSEIKRMIPCMTLFYNSTWNWEMTKYWDIEVAEPITKIISGNGTVKVHELPSVDKMACIVHNGSFSEIGKTYKFISQWIEKNNYKISGPVREIYHKGEWATNNPEEYITELQFPLI